MYMMPEPEKFDRFLLVIGLVILAAAIGYGAAIYLVFC